MHAAKDSEWTAMTPPAIGEGGLDPKGYSAAARFGRTQPVRGKWQE